MKHVVGLLLTSILSIGAYAHEGILDNFCHNDGPFLQCNFVHDENVSQQTMGIVSNAHIELSFREEASRVLDFFRNDGFYAPPVEAKVTLDRINAPSIDLIIELAPTIKIQNLRVVEVKLNVSRLEGALPQWLLTKAKKYLNESPNISQALTKLINDAIDENGLLSHANKMDDVRVDLVELLRAEGIEAEVSSMVPGNESKATIANAFVTLHDQGMTAFVHFEIDAKQKTKLPIIGWTTVWKFSTNIAGEAKISPDCHVTNVDVRKWGTNTAGFGVLVEPLIDGLYQVIGEQYAEYVLRKEVEKALAQNHEIRMFCGM